MQERSQTTFTSSASFTRPPLPWMRLPLGWGISPGTKKCNLWALRVPFQLKMDISANPSVRTKTITGEWRKHND